MTKGRGVTHRSGLDDKVERGYAPLLYASVAHEAIRHHPCLSTQSTTLGTTLALAREVSDDLHVVDSFSSDETVDLSQQYGAHVVQHAFEHYGAQRNWAIDNLSLRYPWQLHLDADERLTPELIASVQALPEEPTESGFLIARFVEFLGRQMRHGGMSPTWHLRLFRNGHGRCEERKYDQHFYLIQGTVAQLQGDMIDEIRMSLSEWTARHNRWADAEVLEQTDQATAGEAARVQPPLLGNEGGTQTLPARTV